MQSVRRAAARAVFSSSMAVAVPRQQLASFAMQISKANMRQAATTLPLARHFSQTSRFAQEEEDKDAAVEEAVASAQGTGSTAANPFDNNDTSIFISNITFDATEAHLREAFSQYGEIVSINIGRDARGLSRGFGFISYTDKEGAEKAVQEAHKSFWHGRRINVDFRKAPRTPEERASERGEPLSPSEPTSSLYIGNIPYETSDSDLNRLFRELDNVVDVRVAVDRNTGWPRGFAHADFADVESAKNAHEKLSATTIGDRTLRVDFSRENKRRRQTNDS
ncbi:RNA-binding domain-containing protein [Whalleya microplaca]|nr:RNA-binding domain-containing protein [Whalleya microplaca]